MNLKVKSGTAEAEGKGNCVVITIKDKSPFSIEITGFDPNRDITAEKLRYDYTKQEIEDGESL